MKYKVNIIEYEEGWGSRKDDILYFNTLEEAKEYITDFNKENIEEEVPSWYMVAEGPYLVK